MSLTDAGSLCNMNVTPVTIVWQCCFMWQPGCWVIVRLNCEVSNPSLLHILNICHFHLLVSILVVPYWPKWWFWGSSSCSKLVLHHSWTWEPWGHWVHCKYLVFHVDTCNIEWAIVRLKTFANPCSVSQKGSLATCLQTTVKLCQLAKASQEWNQKWNQLENKSESKLKSLLWRTLMCISMIMLCHALPSCTGYSSQGEGWKSSQADWVQACLPCPWK